MPTPLRWLSLLCVALLLAGLTGIAIHHTGGSPASGREKVPKVTSGTAPGSSTKSTGPSRSTPSVTRTRATSPTTTPAPAGPDTGYLEANMLTPTDMGGYYRIVPATADELLASAPCLAGLQPAPGQSGRSTTALVGPDSFGLPTIVEVVQSYPGDTAAAVYRAVTAAITACPTFSFAFGGTHQAVAVETSAISPVGDSDQTWQGSFSYSGRTVKVQIGIVRSSQLVIAMVYLDSVPAAAAIMGTFPSTLMAAIGKLAQ